MANSLVLNRRPKVPAEDTAAFGAIAERFRRAGALEQAVSLCREGLKKFPDHVSARVTLGWSLLDLGKYDEARIELEQVMRRAPDNLAAIRGLAELHDRFEHTLNLPMDGPGQWPPPAESVPADEVHDPIAIQDTAEAAPELFEVQAAVAEEPVPAPAMAAETGAAVWTAEASAPETEVSYTEATAPGAGMGSMRDPFADAPAASSIPIQTEPVAAAEPAAAVGAITSEELVSDPDIAALIAEADSLDAAIDLELNASAAFDLNDAPIELAATDEDLAGLAAEVHAEIPLTAPMAATGTTELAAAVPVAADAIAEDEVAVEAAGVAFAAEGPIAEPVAEPVAMASAVAEPVIAEVSEPVVIEPVRAEVAEMVAPIVAAELEAVSDAEPASVIAFAPAAAVAATRNQAVVAALERMLSRVQARRKQLMAESVA